MMSKVSRERIQRLAAPLAALAVFALVATGRAATAQSSLPDRLADTTFWRLAHELSEPNGFFRSDNLLSNETSFQWVVPALQKMTRPDGVYLGVAPEQNFTFIAALKPRIAFIIDIRRGNLLEHLMYKALFEMSDNRVDFAFRLFGRKRPAGLSNGAGVEELITQVATAPLDTAYARGVLDQVKNRLTKTHGFPLSKEDLEYIDYVFIAFSGAGPRIRYNMGGYGGGFGGRGGMPSYADLMTETDSTGAHRAYLASDETYAVIRDMELRNAIVPFTGDFAGPKALRAFGNWVRERHGVVQAIYVSNVEQYLFQDVDNWRKYYDNVATLPLDSTSVFIRSASQGFGNRQQSPNSRQAELLCPVQAHLKGFADGKIRGYYDVFGYCR